MHCAIFALGWTKPGGCRMERCMKAMDPAVTDCFIELLRERYKQKPPPLTKEDAVRYTYFLALFQQRAVEHYDIVLEAGVDGLKGREIDTLILGRELRPAFYLEFKHDRDRTKIKPTKRAADLFSDVLKMAKISIANAEKFVVYLSEIKMRSFWSSGDSFKKIMTLEKGETLKIDQTFLENCPASFRKNVRWKDAACEVRVVLKENADEWDLRIFQVLSPGTFY